MTDKGKAACQSGGERAMNPSSYTKDTLVQQTTAKYLEYQLDWESVYTYNNEDFGPGSLPRLINGEVAV
jgi:hypothetical protein